MTSSSICVQRYGTAIFYLVNFNSHAGSGSSTDSVHAKERARRMHENTQTEDFDAHHLTDENVAIIPNASHGEHASTEEEVLALCQLCLDFPDEDDEDFDDHVHRAASIFKLELCEDSPWEVGCSCPRYDLHAVCKHAIQHAWSNDVISKPLELSLKKLTQNKKRRRSRKLGNEHSFDVLFFIFLNTHFIGLY